MTSSEEVKRIKVAHERAEDTTSSSASTKKNGIKHVLEENMGVAASGNIKNIQDLPNDVFRHCLEFVGKGNFAFVAPVSKQFYWNYINLGVEMKNNVIDVDVILQQGRNKKTTVKDAVTGSLRLATECFLKAPKEFQVEACRQAAVNGRLDILKCAVSFGIDMKQSVFPYRDADGSGFYDLLVQLAETVANGHLDVIEFLYDHGIDFDDEDIITEIKDRGKASSLHWMMEEGMISPCWEDQVFTYLVQDGEIDILKKSYGDSSNYVNEFTFVQCAKGGSIEVMKWLLQENDCEWSSYLFYNAAQSGSIPIMELCLQHGCPNDEYICAGTIKNKNKEAALDALKWFRAHDWAWSSRVCENAAEYGNLKALKWARENGCPWDSHTFNCAAQYGHMEILDYCFENKCLVDHSSIYHYPFEDEFFDSTFSELQERSLRVYKWLHQHSIPWDKEVSLVAAQEGHLKP
ncbi:hypothetical protein CTEN210_09147 [Chaetoceros tenuissimus]|uniref:Ankyrin repeat-containing domain n=1 Tax=Chaetoceros tenuissimus TaxID=426638 RepID=A0AAD3CWX2_9STRA|nr:hypothetical protein CTEN210_09147 [Chaetoceros tenuissimus]